MSTFLTRRTLRRRSDALQTLITFQIEGEWFALPIQVAQRVVPLQQVYGQAANGSLGLMRYQSQEIVVLDVRSRLFTRPLPAALPAAGGTAAGEAETGETAITQRTIAQPHLLILDWSEELLGIRLEAPPVLRRVARSAFAPVPPTYLLESGIRCVSALVTPSETEPPLFFLNLEQLLEVRSLPAASPPQ